VFWPTRDTPLPTVTSRAATSRMGARMGVSSKKVHHAYTRSAAQI
jgi:hypothetical protein